MRKIFVLIAAIIALLSVNVNAQVNLGKLKNKLKDKVSSVTGDNSGDNSTPSSSSSTSSSNSSSSSSSSSKDKDEEDPFKLVKDYGMTDGIHANHLKEIVFSKTSIYFQSGKEEQLTKTFNLGDDIYFMAYFENSYMNQWRKEKVNIPTEAEPVTDVWFEVNGVVVGKDQPNSFQIIHGNTYPEQVQRWTGLSNPQYSLLKCETHKRDNFQLAFHSYVIPVLKPGANTVKMFVSFHVIEPWKQDGDNSNRKNMYVPAQPMASGEITINVKSVADIKNILFNNGFIDKARQSNPALEKQIMTVYNDNSSDSKAVKVMIMYSDWNTRTNDYGVIIERYMECKVIVTTKDPNFYQIWTKDVAQQYTGGGNYSSKIILSNIMEDPYIVPALLFK